MTNRLACDLEHDGWLNKKSTRSRSLVLKMQSERKERRKQTKKDFSAKGQQSSIFFSLVCVAFLKSNVSKNNRLAIEFFQ